MNNRRKTAYLCAIGTTIIWGAAFPIVKPSLEFIRPEQFLFLRYALAAICMLPILISSLQKKTFPYKNFWTIIGIECVSMAVLLILYAGLEKTAAIQASFILNTKPIIMTLAGIFLLKEIESHQEFVGLTISVIGTAIVIASPLFFGLGNSNSVNPNINWGNSLILLAVCIEVFYLLKVKKHYENIDKTLIVAISTIVGTLLFGSINLMTGNFPTSQVFSHPEVLLAVGYMGILGTSIATSLSLKAYSLIESSEVVLFEYLNPLIYIPLSVLWLKDSLLPTQAIGISLVVVGVFIAEARKITKRKKPLKQEAPFLSPLVD